MAQSDDSAAASGSTGARGRRVLTLVVLSVVLVAALVGVDFLVLGVNNPVRALNPHYYMALGDSLSFGFQPNFDFSSGFADDLFNRLKQANVTDIENYACAGEKTDSMINGQCPGRFAHKGSYTGPQLQAAINFLKAERHQGRVSPVTLEIGANDVITDWDESTCSIKASADANTDLARMDANLTQTILPQLIEALGHGARAGYGDLHLLNYYNPYAKECPDSAPFVHKLNDHLQADAAKFGIPVVDVYAKFGGDSDMASTICKYTWICSQFHDIHPTNDGYLKIAEAIESTLGLPTGNPLPGIFPPLGRISSQPAAFLRRSAWAMA